MSDHPADPSLIESDLDRTRSRLGSHLNELQDRLSPGQVLDDVMAYFRGSEGAAFGQGLLANVRANPMPAALTGIGLAWLMASGPRAGQSATAGSRDAPGSHVFGRDDYGATASRIQEAEASVARQPAEADNAYAARLDDVRGQAIGLARHHQESQISFSSRVNDALAVVRDAVSQSTKDLRDRAGSAASAAGGAASLMAASVQDAAQGALQAASGVVTQEGRAGGSLATALVESPVLLGALGLAAGALLGALLPQTEQEEAALGGIAGQARDAATSLAREGIERGKQVAQAVVDKGRDSVQAQGLGSKSPGELVDAALSGDLAGSAKAVMQDVLKTGDEAVRKGLEPSNSAADQAPRAPRPSA